MNKKLIIGKIRIFDQPQTGFDWIEDIRAQTDEMRGMMVSGDAVWIDSKQIVLFPVIIRENLTTSVCFSRYCNLLDWHAECNEEIITFIDQFDGQFKFDIVKIGEWIIILKITGNPSGNLSRVMLRSASALNAKLAKLMSARWGKMPTVPCQPDSRHKSNHWLRIGVR